MKEIILYLRNGGFIRSLCSNEQLEDLRAGKGFKSDMYGFIASANIKEFAVV